MTNKAKAISKEIEVAAGNGETEEAAMQSIGGTGN